MFDLYDNFMGPRNILISDTTLFLDCEGNSRRAWQAILLAAGLSQLCIDLGEQWGAGYL